MIRLSNVEFMLLQIIAECKQASGYEINKLIERRGYREWANIGTTSVYVGLQKLKDKHLIRSEHSGKKIGKGPSPSQFIVTETGMETLRDEVASSLSTTRERDHRFSLGLAALPFIGKEEAVAALRERQSFLENTMSHIKRKFEAQGGSRLPLHVRSLFLLPIRRIEQENEWLTELVNELSVDAEGHVHDH